MYVCSHASLNMKEVTRARRVAESAVQSARDGRAKNNSQHLKQLSDRESDALVLLAVILAIERDNLGALKSVRQAVDLTPESFDAQFALGRALYGSGDLSNAAIAFRKAILLRPSDFQSRFFLGTTLEAAGEFDEAHEVY